MARFLTTVVRAERFSDGVLGQHLTDGRFQSRTRRLAQWLQAPQAETALPGTPVGDDDLRTLGFAPHELQFGEEARWDGDGLGINWTIVGDVPSGPGLYAFTVGDGERLHVAYVGMAKRLWGIAKGYDPEQRKARPGQRYGRPKWAGTTRKRVNGTSLLNSTPSAVTSNTGSGCSQKTRHASRRRG